MMLAIIFLISTASLCSGADRDGGILVVAPSAVEACAQAVAALRETVEKTTPVTVIEPGPELEKALARNPRVIVAVGSEALRAVLAQKPSPPIVASMVMATGESAKNQRVAASVSLEVPVAAFLAQARRVLPDKTRVGILRNPAGAITAASLREQAKKEGFSALVVDCVGPDELVKTFLSLKGKADLVLCLPDSALYNSATAKPLVTASLQNGLPIIGFSSSFVKAGAAMGVFPQFDAVGRQTGELVLRCVSGSGCTGDESPKRLAIALNMKVFRLLGLETKVGEEAGVAVYR